MRSTIHTLFACALAVSGVLAACSGGTGIEDAAMGTDGQVSQHDTGVPLCGSDRDCSDDRFCNGVERCDPATSTLPSGCIPGVPPCEMDGVTCVEAASRCQTDCGTSGDADGDGHDSTDCGGGDCDDSNGSVHPGTPEVCDMEGIDEDCNPETVGPDADGDGYVPTECCYRAPGAIDPVCGGDCDDSNPNISPAASEICNGIDDNCNGLIDEGVTRDCWPDADGDGYAAADAVPVPTCGNCPAGTTSLNPVGSAFVDCDDTRADRYPGAPELCDRFDSDCSMPTEEEPSEDEDGDGHAPIGAACTGGPLPKDDCYDTNSDVFPGQTSYFTTDRGDGSFDYNCDGSETRRWPSQAGRCAPPGGYCPAGQEYICAVTEGFSSRSSVPSCGNLGSAFVVGCRCSAHASYCDEIIESRTQECR